MEVVGGGRRILYIIIIIMSPFFRLAIKGVDMGMGMNGFAFKSLLLNQ